MTIDFFSYDLEEKVLKNAPLADKMRPDSLVDFFGQEDLVGEGGFLNRAIKSDRIPSMIFYGPPGTGKTTLARIIAKSTKKYFEELSAVTSGIQDIKRVSKDAENRLTLDDLRTILFIDEIHRFNKSQQDALLPFVEKGILTLIGATTENPFFEVNKALLSRMTILELNALTKEDLSKIVERAIKDEKGLADYNVVIEDDALEYLVGNSSGDARTCLNALEIAVRSEKRNNEGKTLINLDIIKNSIQVKKVRFDSNGDEHYDTASAFIKSMRGSDVDASLYWLAKMIEAGEDLLFIARRIIITAAEDIGLADPYALTLAVSTFQAVHAIGMPEGRIPLAEAVIYMATAPKSNSAYIAIENAIADIKNEEIRKIPNHLQDTHYRGSSSLGRGEGYLYPHNSPSGYVKQEYMPEKKQYYKAINRGYEKKIYDDPNFTKDNI
ncbi:MAG: replication-associated recombination protein A [Tissierellia bacterium]|nr:replication-associated recombination protein A [Tissierellia bacterium]